MPRPDPASVVVSELVDADDDPLGRRGAQHERIGERPDPGVEIAGRVPAQPGDITVRVVEQPQRDRHRCRAGGQHPVDQQPPDSAVAVDIGVNRLELGVRDRRMQHRVHVAAGHEPDEIVHEAGDLPIRGPFKAGRGSVFADPHRAVAPHAQMSLLHFPVGGKQSAVQPMEPSSGHFEPVGTRREGGGHARCDQLGPGRVTSRLRVVVKVSESSCELRGGGRDVLDRRRRDRVGADEHRAEMPQRSSSCRRGVVQRRHGRVRLGQPPSGVVVYSGHRPTGD